MAQQGVHPPDVRQVLFSNMLALGMDPIALERKWRIPFNRDMFALPNKKGFEVVMYFLFSRLNPAMCQEQFKSCWPIADKKDEQTFRKVCRDWLQTISTEEANANLPLPRIVASLFMSPGGDKIYQLLFYFSSYILEHCIRNENGVRSYEFLQRPVLDKQNKTMSRAMTTGIKASVAQMCKRFITHSRQAVSVQHEWKVYGSELVKSYRTLTRDIRDLEQQVKEEVNIAAEKCAARGSPITGRRKPGVAQYDFDVQSVHRAQRVRKVRELWKSTEDFCKDYEKDREVIDFILEGTKNSVCVDAKDLNLRIPDLLLRECEQEIQRRNVDNVYKGGKLNLLSLIHLWNLALHLYIEKIHETGLPHLEEVTPKVTTHVHTHRAHLTNTQHLRSRLKYQTIPKLQKDIQAMRNKLDAQVFRAKSPDSIRMTSLGLGFMPPTPPVNFSGDGGDPSLVPGHESIRMVPEQVSTPEAASALMDNIYQRVHDKEMSKIVQGTPVFATRLATQGQPMGRNAIPTSKLPVRGTVNYEKAGNKRIRHYPVSPLSMPDSSERVSATASGTTLHQTSLEVSEGARQAIMAQVSKPKAQGNKKTEKFKVPSRATHSAKKNYQTSSKPVPKAERQSDKKSPKALDILADQIADAVIYGTASPNYRHIIGGFDLDLDAQAFVSKDKLMRTPPNQSPRSQDSLGPLSSTRIEHGASDVERGMASDRIVTKLFTGDGSDEDDGSIITLTSEPEPRRPASSQRRHHPSGCEDDATPKKATSPQSSPAADKVRDMSPGFSQSEPLPKGRSLALTSGALVMTGDMFGMTEQDHLAGAKRPIQRADWGSVSDSGSESNTEQLSGPERVAALPESSDTDSFYSQELATKYADIRERFQNRNNSSRNVLGAELVDISNIADKHTELIQSKDKEAIRSSPRNMNTSFSTGGGDEFSHTTRNNQPGGSRNEAKQNKSLEKDDFNELVTASARVLEQQNDSLTETKSTKVDKASLLADDSPPLGGGFSRNSGARGSFRDVEQNVLQSFVSSSLQTLTQNLGHIKLPGERLGRHSPVRSRSPRVGEPAINQPREVNVADILTRYKLVKERQAASRKATTNDTSPGSTASSSLHSSPANSRARTPEPAARTPVLSERYLQRTPTKEDVAMSKRFSLNLDNEDDVDQEVTRVSPLRPRFTGGGSNLQFGNLNISPLNLSQAYGDTPKQSLRESPPRTTPQRPRPPESLLKKLQRSSISDRIQTYTVPTGAASGSPHNTVAATPASPVINALHMFDLEPSTTGRMSFENIFDEEGPVLVPLSPVLDDPFNRTHKTPKVAQLIDL